MHANVSRIANGVHGVADGLPVKQLEVATEHASAASTLLRAVAGGSEVLQTVSDELDAANAHLSVSRAALGMAALAALAYTAEISGSAALEGSEGIEAAPAAAEEIQRRLATGESFFDMDEQGTIRPLDPITGSVMHPGEMPASLLTDPEIRCGVGFWRQYGHEINFRVLGTRHEHAEDIKQWGIDLRAEATRLAARGGILFVEGVGSEALQADAEAMLGMSANAGPAIRPAFIRTLDELGAASPAFRYYAEVARQIMSTGVATAIPDYTAGGKRPGDIVLTAWRQQSEAVDLKNAPPGAPAIRAILQRMSLNLGQDLYRDMQFFGRMGAALARRHTPGQATDVAWIGGAMHETMGQHVAAHGATVTYAHDRAQLGEAHAIELEMHRQGRITPELFKRFMDSF